MSYTYLPDIVVHRLMIYCQKYLRIDLCWRKGMRIDFFSFGLTAIIDIGNGNDNLCIDLYAYGNHTSWELLQPLRECILNINKELNLHSIDYVVVQKQFGNVLKDNQITKKSKFEILRGILGDVANGITVASPIVTAITSHWSQIRKGVGQIIQTFAPILLKCL